MLVYSILKYGLKVSNILRALNFPDFLAFKVYVLLGITFDLVNIMLMKKMNMYDEIISNLF